MALVTQFESRELSRNSIHDEIEASYSVFKLDGHTYLQIDTYGQPDREMPGKKSQTLQLNEAGAKALHKILTREFGL